MRTNAHNKKDRAITVDPNMPDFSKSPFVIKKVESARALIAKYGLPKETKSKKAK